MNLSLPTDSAKRKNYPLIGGLFGYFAAALAGVAHHSWKSNEKHNRGLPLHWLIDKSNDHAECCGRHLLDLHEMIAVVERLDMGRTPDERAAQIGALLDEANALAWRALALSQTLHITYADAPLPFNARKTATKDMAASITETIRDFRKNEVRLPATYTAALSDHPYSRDLQFVPRTEGYPAGRCSLCMSQPCSCDPRPSGLR